VILLLLACLDNTPIPGGEAESFVAMQVDFARYASWESFPVDTGDTGHPEGDRIVYVNARPEDGATAFPVGTILVKTIAWSGGLDVHAMVKRGGGFNPDGATGWEWFELVPADDGTPVIKWRGAEPPSGEIYQSLPGSTDSGDAVTGDCNVCHAAAIANDFVHTVPL
jgi:hypothetical protein